MYNDFRQALKLESRNFGFEFVNYDYLDPSVITVTQNGLTTLKKEFAFFELVPIKNADGYATSLLGQEVLNARALGPNVTVKFYPHSADNSVNGHVVRTQVSISFNSIMNEDINQVPSASTVKHETIHLKNNIALYQGYACAGCVQINNAPVADDAINPYYNETRVDELTAHMENLKTTVERTLNGSLKLDGTTYNSDAVKFTRRVRDMAATNIMVGKLLQSASTNATYVSSMGVNLSDGSKALALPLDNIYHPTQPKMLITVPISFGLTVQEKQQQLLEIGRQIEAEGRQALNDSHTVIRQLYSRKMIGEMDYLLYMSFHLEDAEALGIMLNADGSVAHPSQDTMPVLNADGTPMARTPVDSLTNAYRDYDPFFVKGTVTSDLSKIPEVFRLEPPARTVQEAGSLVRTYREYTRDYLTSPYSYTKRTVGTLQYTQRPTPALEIGQIEFQSAKQFLSPSSQVGALKFAAKAGVVSGVIEFATGLGNAASAYQAETTLEGRQAVIDRTILSMRQNIAGGAVVVGAIGLSGGTATMILLATGAEATTATATGAVVVAGLTGYVVGTGIESIIFNRDGARDKLISGAQGFINDCASNSCQNIIEVSRGVIEMNLSIMAYNFEKPGRLVTGLSQMLSGVGAVAKALNTGNISLEESTKALVEALAGANPQNLRKVMSGQSITTYPAPVPTNPLWSQLQMGNINDLGATASCLKNPVYCNYFDNLTAEIAFSLKSLNRNAVITILPGSVKDENGNWVRVTDIAYETNLMTGAVTAFRVKYDENGQAVSTTVIKTSSLPSDGSTGSTGGTGTDTGTGTGGTGSSTISSVGLASGNLNSVYSGLYNVYNNLNSTSLPATDIANQLSGLQFSINPTEQLSFVTDINSFKFYVPQLSINTTGTGAVLASPITPLRGIPLNQDYPVGSRKKIRTASGL